MTRKKNKNKLNLHRLGLDPADEVDTDEVDDESSEDMLEDVEQIVEENEEVEEVEEVLEETEEMKEVDFVEEHDDLENIMIAEEKPVVIDLPVKHIEVRVMVRRLKSFAEPRMDSSILGLVKEDEKFIIAEEVIGSDGMRWGRIGGLNYFAWLPLDYCQRIPS